MIFKTRKAFLNVVTVRKDNFKTGQKGKQGVGRWGWSNSGNERVQNKDKNQSKILPR